MSVLQLPAVCCHSCGPSLDAGPVGFHFGEEKDSSALSFPCWEDLVGRADPILFLEILLKCKYLEFLCHESLSALCRPPSLVAPSSGAQALGCWQHSRAELLPAPGLTDVLAVEAQQSESLARL